MSKQHTNPLALTPSQVEHRENHEKIDLTNVQIAYLQKHGLLAGPQNWYYPRGGTFALTPIHPKAASHQRRKRVYLASHTSAEAA